MQGGMDDCTKIASSSIMESEDSRSALRDQ